MTFSHWIGSKRIDKRVEKLMFLPREERIILVTTQNFRELNFLIFCSLCLGQEYEVMKSEKNVPLQYFFLRWPNFALQLLKFCVMY